MANTYNLVNPFIKGEFKSKITASNSLEAARTFYNDISQHFNGTVPKFYFTIQKGQSGSGKLYHFEVQEKILKNNNVQFSLEPYTNNNENIQSFTNKLSAIKDKFVQEGGKKKRHGKKKHHKRKTESSDSESEDDYKIYYPSVYNTPLYYWWYDPYVYNLSSVYVPTFQPYVTPTIQVATVL